MKITKMDRVEKTRLEALELYEDMNGPLLPESCSPTSSNFYQAQQATEILSETLKTFLMQNPLLVSDPALFRLGILAQDALDEISALLSQKLS